MNTAAPEIDNRLAMARKVADAVLWEGYVLYPYRASAPKNQVRFQFGVLAPRQWSEAGGCEAWMNQTECLVEASAAFEISGKTRFLQVQRRCLEEPCDSDSGQYRLVDSIEREGELWTSWDEAVEQAIDIHIAVPAAGGEWVVPFQVSGGLQAEALHVPSGRFVGWCVRRRAEIAGRVYVDADRIASNLVRVRLQVENLTPWSDLSSTRDEAVRAALVGVHSLLACDGGRFLSMTDPPAWAAPPAAACRNVRTWPVLVAGTDGDELLLSSPIILYDYPEVAPESPGDLFDATEIDEILSLRTMTLTDEEKRQARATDARAAAVLDRVDNMPGDIWQRLHGAIRSLRSPSEAAVVPGVPPLTVASAEPGVAFGNDEPKSAPWWDPATDAAVDPGTDAITIGGVTVARGSRVRLRPGRRRADAQDMFLVGRVARVEGVYFDVDERNYLAVTLEDDPAADLHQIHGRFLYFAPDEVEPLETRR